MKKIFISLAIIVFSASGSSTFAAPDPYANAYATELSVVSRVDSYPGQPSNPGYPYPPPLPPMPPLPPTPSYPPYPPSGGQPGSPSHPGYETADSLYREGTAAAARGDTQTAIARFQRLLDRFPSDSRAPEAAFRGGECARQAGNFSDALIFYRRVVSSYSNSSRCEEAFYDVGFCLVKLNDHRGALDQYSAFIRRYPNSRLADDAWYVLGRTYEQLNDPNDAATCYRELMNRFPSSEFYSKAQDRLRQIDSSYPPNQPPTYPPSYPPSQQYQTDRDLYDSGHTHLARGNYNAARTFFDELLKRYPSSTWADDAMLWKGKSYIEERNWTAGSDVFYQFKSWYAGSELLSEACYDYAWCLYQVGMTSAANRTVFQQAASEFSNFAYRFSTHPWAAEALYMAGECFDRYGNAQTARSYYQATITRYPSSSSAQKARERLNGTY